MRFSDKIVVVTGGARGIGRATVEAFESEGASVVVADLLADSPVDVADTNQVQALFRGVQERYGRLDVLVANAGKPYSNTTLRATEEDWEQCLAANLKSVWLCAREAFPLLREAGGSASIVTVASYHGLRSSKSSFPYSAAKGGVLALTRSLAVEYAPQIRVNAVIPGQIESVRTEPFFGSFRDPAEARRRVLSTFPMGRLGKPEDIAKAILFLASNDASWITGTFLTVDGGRDAAMLDLSDLKGGQR
jgi:meso-butanediol dehydrogenase / (S,S)-butanediol dehydrogenase / diacetyl reductase